MLGFFSQSQSGGLHRAESLLLFFVCVYGLGCALSQSLMSLGGTVFALLAVVDLVMDRAPRRPLDHKIAIVGVALVLYLVANLLLRPWDERSAHTLGTLPLFWVPMFGAVVVWKPDERRWAPALAIIAAAIWVTSLRSVYQFTMGTGQGVGFFKNPIYYAYSLLPALVFFGEQWRERRDVAFFTHRWAAVACIGCAVGLITAETRMAWATAALYGAIRIVPALGRRYGKWIWVALPLIGALAFAGLYHNHTRFRAKVAKTISGQDRSKDWRIKAWQYNWDLFLEHPVVGVGPEKNGIDTAVQTKMAGHWDPGFQIYAHSIYFQALAETGIIGFGLLVAFFLLLARHNSVAGAIVAAFAFSGLTENVLNNSRAAHPVYFFLMLALLMERPVTPPSRPSEAA